MDDHRYCRGCERHSIDCTCEPARNLIGANNLCWMTKQHETMHEGDACFNCGAVMDDFTQITNDEDNFPRADDVSICYYCAHVSYYTGDKLHRREPTPEEQARLDADPQMQKILNAFKLAKNKTTAKPHSN